MDKAPEGKFVPVTSLRPGDRIVAGLITATRMTSERVYITVLGDGRSGPFTFHQARSSYLLRLEQGV